MKCSFVYEDCKYSDSIICEVIYKYVRTQQKFVLLQEITRTYLLTYLITYLHTYLLTHSLTHLLTYLLTYTMEQSPSWEVDQF